MTKVATALLVCAGSLTILRAQNEAYIKQLHETVPFGAEIARSAVFIPSALVAMASASQELIVFDGSSFTQIFSYPRLPANLSSLTFTTDGRLLTARTDGQVNFWDAAKGTMLQSFTAHSEGIVQCLARSDGRLVIVGSDNSVVLFDPLEASSISSFEVESDRITSLALHPDGKTVAVGLASGKIAVYDSSLASKPPGLAMEGLPVVLGFSPDGRLLACGGNDGRLTFWNTATLEPAGVGLVQGSVTAMAFDPEGHWFAATSSDGSLTLYDLKTLSPRKTLRLEGSVFTAVAFTSAETMATGTSGGAVAFWRVLPTAPDTTAPTLTILRPARYTEDAPSQIYGKQYDVAGVVYDENPIARVDVGGREANLADVTQQAMMAGAGLRGKEFRVSIPLSVVGMNKIEVQAFDSAGNATMQTLFIRRLTSTEAVEILAPVANSETEHVAVEVEIKPWFDVASYAISVNTVDLVDHRSGVRVRAGEVIREEVPLIVGYNQIGITLVSRDGERFTKLVGVNRKFSAAITETVRREGGSAKSTGPQRWAVIVGVSEYANKGIPSLKYADRDAEALAAFLQTPEGGGFDADHMRILVNENATLPNLREALIDFLQQAIDKDLVVIYFAGHGAPDPTRPQNLYLLTHDTDPNRLGTTAFPMWDIQTVIARQIAAKKVVVLSDACHSGGISVDVATRGLDVTQSNPINQYLAELARAKEGMVVFTASAAGEVSQEFPELGHGVFTYYLLEGLKGAADLNNDYLVTINELMAYVEEQVKRKTRGAQNPTRSQTTYDKELPMAVLNR